MIGGVRLGEELAQSTAIALSSPLPVMRRVTRTAPHSVGQTLDRYPAYGAVQGRCTRQRTALVPECQRDCLRCPVPAFFEEAGDCLDVRALTLGCAEPDLFPPEPAPSESRPASSGEPAPQIARVNGRPIYQHEVVDVLYRGLKLPRVQEGDVLVVMNSGAYFTSTATNFGGPRPGVLMLDGPSARMVRRHETHQDLAAVELVLPPRAPTG